MTDRGKEGLYSHLILNFREIIYEQIYIPVYIIFSVNRFKFCNKILCKFVDINTLKIIN